MRNKPLDTSTKEKKASQEEVKSLRNNRRTNMKILALMMLMVVGCGKTEQPVKELTLEEKVVGTYESKASDGSTGKFIFFENGKVEAYNNGKKYEDDPKWKIVGFEVHIMGRWISVYNIESNGDFTLTARIKDGTREAPPKKFQLTFKKIK